MTSAIAKKNSLTWHRALVSRKDRERLHGHRGFLIWFTGLSASGKSTLAHRVEQTLHAKRCSTYVFDGDNVRHGLCGDLGFSETDRKENIRRIGEMCNLFIDAGIIAMAAFISPYRADREQIRHLVGNDRFVEIYLDCPVAVCAERDPKGIYKRAMEGVIKNFTGISAPYEPPIHPDLRIETHMQTIEASTNQVMDMLLTKGYVIGGAMKKPTERIISG